MENYAISVILQKSRESLSYSRKEVCHLCQEQFSEKTLYRVEQGITKAGNDTMERLGSLYQRPFNKLHSTIDMNKYSMLRLYGEIITCAFQMNFTEAEYKLKLFEKYVEKNPEDLDVIELLRVIIKHYKQEDYTKEGKTIVLDMEKMIRANFHPSADISVYPLTDMELNLYFVYVDALREDGQYEFAIELINKLLKNINQGYHNESIFCDYYGLLSTQLATIYEKTDRHEEAMKIVREAIKRMIEMGDLSNIYHLYYIFVQIAEEKMYFGDENIKKECIDSLKTMHSICVSCNMTQRVKKIEKKLKNKYGVAGDFW